MTEKKGQDASFLRPIGPKITLQKKKGENTDCKEQEERIKGEKCTYS